MQHYDISLCQLITSTRQLWFRSRLSFSDLFASFSDGVITKRRSTTRSSCLFASSDGRYESLTPCLMTGRTCSSRLALSATTPNSRTSRPATYGFASHNHHHHRSTSALSCFGPFFRFVISSLFLGIRQVSSSLCPCNVSSALVVHECTTRAHRCATTGYRLEILYRPKTPSFSQPAPTHRIASGHLYLASYASPLLRPFRCSQVQTCFYGIDIWESNSSHQISNYRPCALCTLLTPYFAQQSCLAACGPLCRPCTCSFCLPKSSVSPMHRCTFNYYLPLGPSLDDLSVAPETTFLRVTVRRPSRVQCSPHL